MAEPTERRLKVVRRIAALKATAVGLVVAVTTWWFLLRDAAEFARFAEAWNSWTGLVVLLPFLIWLAVVAIWREKFRQMPRERLVALSAWIGIACPLIGFELIVVYVKMTP